MSGPVDIFNAGQAVALADETSVAEYKVAWGGSAGGSNASSSSPYYSPDDTITLDKDGDYTFDVLPYQRTFSQENGTATGGIFYLKDSGGSTIETLTFPWKKRDSNESFFPYEGGRQTIHRANMAAGTYRLSFTSHAGSGGGNRVSYEGYAHVIARRASLISGEAAGRRIYTRVEDLLVPNANWNTYAVDLPDLEAGDEFTVVMARNTFVYDLVGRFLTFGQQHEFVFAGTVWRIEVIGTQLRIQATSGGGTQVVKAIFIERQQS